jgi:uncharacterized membrane protein YgcG
MKRFIFALLLLLPSSMAFANCNALVEDRAGVISDVSKVEHAAGAISANVRVRTIQNVGGDSLDKYVHSTLATECPQWMAPNKKDFQSMMLIFVYTPDRSQTGIFYGSTLQPRIGNGKWMDVARSRFVPAIHAYKSGEKTALTDGFVNTLGELNTLIVRPSTAGNVTINQASDNSGLWSALKWLIAIGFLIGMGMMFIRWRSNRASVRAAQSEAKRVRSDLVSQLLNMISPTELSILKSKIINAPKKAQPGLNVLLQAYQEKLQAAQQELSSFDSINEDPNDKWLSVEAYENNQGKYEKIYRDWISPAKMLADQIRSGKVVDGHHSHQTETETETKSSPFTTNATGSNRRYDTEMDSASAAPTTSSTTIIERDSSPSVVFVPTPTYEPSYERPSYSRRREREDDDDTSSSRSSSSSWGSSSSSSRSDDDDDSSSSSSDSGSSFSDSSDSSDSGSSFSDDSSSSSDSGGSFSSDD